MEIDEECKRLVRKWARREVREYKNIRPLLAFSGDPEWDYWTWLDLFDGEYGWGNIIDCLYEAEAIFLNEVEKQLHRELEC